MMTEDEALTKWCPQSRVVLDYGGGHATSANRGDADESDHLWIDSRCVGSACMAWRAVTEKERHSTKGPPIPPGWELDKWADTGTPDYVGMKRTVGFCGLAGRPE